MDMKTVYEAVRSYEQHTPVPLNLSIKEGPYSVYVNFYIKQVAVLNNVTNMISWYEYPEGLRQLAYREPQKETACNHQWINVGFMSLNIRCKWCDALAPEGTVPHA